MVDCAPDDCKAEIHYKFLYNYVCTEIDKIKEFDKNGGISSDYKMIQSLAALYQIQEYSANQLAEYADDADC
jgi:hypothetical protein